MAVTLKGQTAVYEGTSTDTKPIDADNNAIFKELDTGIRYYYDGTDWNEIPRSGGGGGGGTGTDNYNELNNKPSINGTTLSGNKSLDNLGIQAKLTFDSAPTEDSENPVKSGGVYSALAGKQDMISDLSTIRRGAAAGASAVQPAAMEAALAQKQDAISDLSTIRRGAAAGATAVQPATLETALAGKQDALSSEQLAAVNSGITEEDVTQIGVNKNNILSIENLIGCGGINILDLTKATNITVSTNMSYVTNADGTLTVTATNANAGEAIYFQNVIIPNGILIFSGCPSGGSDNTYSVQIYGSDETRLTTDYGTGSDSFTISDNRVGVRIRVGTGTNTFTISPIIVYKTLWDNGFTSYQQYQPTNAELYALIKSYHNT